MAKKITAEFQILFHPDLADKAKELALLYTTNGGRNWDDYFANRLTDKNWQITMYDLNEGPIEFFLRIILKDGRIVLGKKDQQNYKVKIRDNSDSNKYKAQIRLTQDNFVPVGRKCLVCEDIIPTGQYICKTPGCHASFCPDCSRMLPPFSNYCPWDKKLIA